MTIELLTSDDLTIAENEALWDSGVNLDDWDYLLIVPESALSTREDGECRETSFSECRPPYYGEAGYTHDLARLLTGCCDNLWYTVAFRGKMVGMGVAYHG